MQGRKFLASLLTQPDGVTRFLKMNPRAEWFLGVDREIFDLVETHVSKYGAFPQAEALKGIELPHAAEAPEFYLDETRKAYLHHILYQGLQAAGNSLNSADPEAALASLGESVVAGLRAGQKSPIVDYAQEGYDLIAGHHNALKKGLITRVPTGWPSLDGLLKGLAGGDVLSVVGRPANGKTFMLLWAALHAWKQAFMPLVFSMEMNHLAISERLAGMQAPVDLQQIKTGDFASMFSNKKQQLYNVLLDNKHQHPFWLVDGAMTATVDDVITFTRHLRPDAVYIDGAYLLRAKGDIPRWERNTSNLERLKGEVAEALNIPVIISYQFNRQGSKAAVTKGDKEAKPGLENIGYTDAVGQISSIVLGMLEDENIKTKKRREVSILKGRDGQTASFHINWQFEPHKGLNFSEVDPKANVEKLNNV